MIKPAHIEAGKINIKKMLDADNPKPNITPPIKGPVMAPIRPADNAAPTPVLLIAEG